MRKPERADAEAIFARYASDRDALRYMGWPAHASVADTRAFLEFSDAEWERWPGGPYLVLSEDGRLLGATGFTFESPGSAATGYVLARDAWGQGYATEALSAVVGVARALALPRLFAVCHAEHRASARVLEKAGFVLEQRLPSHQVFPNLAPEPQDVLVYALGAAAPGSSEFPGTR